MDFDDRRDDVDRRQADSFLPFDFTRLRLSGPLWVREFRVFSLIKIRSIENLINSPYRHRGVVRELSIPSIAQSITARLSIIFHFGSFQAKSLAQTLCVFCVRDSFQSNEKCESLSRNAFSSCVAISFDSLVFTSLSLRLNSRVLCHISFASESWRLLDFSSVLWLVRVLHPKKTPN